MQQKIKFLRAKIKESIDEPQYYTLENAPAIKKIKNDFENLPQEQQKQLKNELEQTSSINFQKSNAV